MSLLDQGKGNRQRQTNEINLGRPKLRNWPYDAVPIDTDQNPNVDAHPDLHRQTDGEFLRHGQTGSNSTKPAQASEPGPYRSERTEKALIGICEALLIAALPSKYQRALKVSTPVAIILQQMPHPFMKSLIPFYHCFSFHI